ncbi:intercellular adhesion molecule 1 [Echinops telfairi]|uniref:Intercellular adhesion molecule 1 n=1 Tax=Echinops telfairi TaxID=9371 RepID=A0ABM0J7X6_ECHTE|nr:intercellular adhesion molecule 1 [Echinops telfairi]
MAPCGAAFLALLCALLPGSGGAQTFVQPLEAILPQRDSLLVNCSTTCDEPETLGLETMLNKKEVGFGTHWKAYELSNILEDSILICFTNCHGVQSEASTNLTVYRLPERVELAPLPAWQPVGDNLTLHCEVAGGAPRAHLSVLLLRGQEELGRQPALGEPARASFTVRARREDHGANFSCRAQLDLRSLGLALFQNSSASRQLRTFALPETRPILTTPRILEVGRETTVTCTLEGVFPVWEAQVYMTLGDQRLNPVTVPDAAPLSVTASVVADSDENETQPLTCAVFLGNQSQQTRETVTIYSFQEPNLTLSEVEVAEGTEVNVVCEAQAAAMVMLSGVPALTPTQSSDHRVHFRLNASAEDNGRSFICSAALEVAGVGLHKNQTQELRVLYGPRIDERDCPSNWTWQEGSEQTLKCQAWGNPRPKVTCCRKGDNFSLPIGDLRPVTRDYAGSYLCRAVSTRGEVTQQVVVTVLYQKYHLVVILTVLTAVILGTSGTTAYLYNRQRKIRKYRLQKAQEATSMKLNTPATPP